MKLKTALVCFFVFLSAAVWAMGSKPGSGLAPDFSLPDLSGNSTIIEKAVRLSDHRDKVVFLNFFATWCPPCRNEMPSMQALYHKLKGKDFEMLAVSIDRDRGKLKAFVKENGYTFKILHDANGLVAAQYGVGGIPATFIIDKTGKIAQSFVGGRDWSDFKVKQ